MGNRHCCFLCCAYMAEPARAGLCGHTRPGESRAGRMHRAFVCTELTCFSAKCWTLRAQIPRRPLETKTGYHFRVLQKAQNACKQMSPGEKVIYRRRAAGEKASRKLAGTPCDQYVDAMSMTQQVSADSVPWGMADEDFPVAERLLEELFVAAWP